LVKKVEIRSDYIYISTTGNYLKTPQAIEIIKEIFELSLKHEVTKFILDISQMKRIPPVQERYELGEIAAKVWGHTLRVAIISKPSDISGFFENVAVNRGASVKVLPSLKEAEEWLSETNPM
jgi:hypothetical protein